MCIPKPTFSHIQHTQGVPCRGAQRVLVDVGAAAGGPHDKPAVRRAVLTAGVPQEVGFEILWRGVVREEGAAAPVAPGRRGRRLISRKFTHNLLDAYHQMNICPRKYKSHTPTHTRTRTHTHAHTKTRTQTHTHACARTRTDTLIFKMPLMNRMQRGTPLFFGNFIQPSRMEAPIEHIKGGVVFCG